MAVGLAWPDPLPGYGSIRLRPFRVGDLPLVEELSQDAYIPQIGTVPVPFTEEAGLAYLARQHQRLVDGTGWSFVAEDRATGREHPSDQIRQNLTPVASKTCDTPHRSAMRGRKRGPGGNLA